MVDQADLSVLSLEVPKTQLGEGTFYWKVEASSEDGRVVRSMSKIKVNDVYYPGVMDFEVRGPEDGEIPL